MANVSYLVIKVHPNSPVISGDFGRGSEQQKGNSHG